MKKVLVIAGFFLFLFLSSAQAVNVDIVPLRLKIFQNQEFSVDIRISSGNQVVYGGQYDLIFDPAILEAISQVKGTFLSQDGANTLVTFNTIDSKVGKVSYGETRMGTSAGVTGAGALASVKFKARNSVASGTTINFGLRNVLLADNTPKEIKGVVVNGNETDYNPIKDTPILTTPVPTLRTPTPIPATTILSTPIPAIIISTTTIPTTPAEIKEGGEKVKKTNPWFWAGFSGFLVLIFIYYIRKLNEWKNKFTKN